MHNALIFQAVIVCAVSLTVIGLKGKQNRRERDEIEAKRPEPGQNSLALAPPRNGADDKEA